MKTNRNGRNLDQRGIFLATALVMSLTLVVGNEMFHHRFATLGYLALSLLSPILVLLVADWRQIRRAARHQS